MDFLPHLDTSLRSFRFGAEEVGLIGSRFYVREFLAKESAPYTVRANLNFDMLGSPNFKRILYAATSCPENVRDGCRASKVSR